ncbi:hypothetical protein [Caballeronia sordidicola]|uniref:Uncharacterized protein n=1 Tax=Caballeronia sordidicola TaxID=196367 RepID=A0A226X744_CABSO|nr:hypothetical protein [Caballeronia sordidicola]OXC79282.1 hypothetical protein BSU04_07680 [Caballeronia sordidicola]
MLIFNTVEKNGEIVLRCALDPLETARVSEVPLWMFEPVACCHVTSAISPVVTCEALRDLKGVVAKIDGAGERSPAILTS